MKKFVITSMLVFLTCLFLASQVAAGEPTDAISKRVTNILNILGDQAVAKEGKKQKVESIVDEVFNYYELSRRTLGKNWKKLDSKQQQEFIDLYSTLLSKVYMDRILEYSDEKVSFLKETVLSKNKAEVKSSIITASKSIPLDYRLVLNDGQWKVYDVIIEGVSMIKNYRSQFKDILTNKSPEKLIEMLRKKTAEA